jgi:hypothetical protein
MRALAEFIMRGRLQAGTIAIFGYIVPLLAPVAVALVALRKGAFEGTLILLLGLSPALLSLVFGESNSIVVWITLLSLVVVYIPALVLRISISLPMMVISAVLTAMLVSATVLLFAPSAVENMVNSLMNQLVSADTSQKAGGVLGGGVTQVSISGMIAYVLAFNGLTGVLLGRWLQSLVFNPGGFGTEFRELRLGVAVSIFCFVASVFLRYQGDEYWWWANMFAIPLLLVAVAIAHQVVQTRKLVTSWLVLFYFAVFIFTPIVMCIGFVDTWINFRNRLQNKQ